MTDEPVNRSLGARLRAVRRAKGLSLLDVESLTSGEFKASVLGAYERGERSLSVSRLVRLAEVYQVDPCELIPEAEPSTVVDLTRLEELSEEQFGLVESFLRAVRRMRTRPPDSEAVRASDLQLLSVILGLDRVDADQG
ncbi:MAG: hypothetical protein KatS3mg011_1206 [Acidimicrobiia bacterium]|nr:MAG: hypothetical protein KatS3mg011_1206 [Acidimicrobiia bacterium]